MKITIDIPDDVASAVVQNACLALGLNPSDDDHARQLVGTSLCERINALNLQGAAVRKQQEEQAAAQAANLKITAS